MPKILLNFLIVLKNCSLPEYSQLPGPLFHRWLPDGMKDAIMLDTGEPNAVLKVWFERMGFVNNGFIEFDYVRREVDPEIIPMQAILKAGSLYGLLEIQDISNEELTALLENRAGDEIYVKLGKKVVNKLLYPPVSKFISIFQSNYGQYWIQELEKWDSREESLGHYCKYRLNLHWSSDNGKTWSKFVPNIPETRPIEFKMDFSPKAIFHEYPTKEDWQELTKVVQEGYEPQLAATILARANQHLDQRNLRQALIEGVSALDVAIGEFFRQKLNSDTTLYSYISELRKMSVAARVITIATSLGKVSKHDIEYAVEAINMRNNVVHDGEDPPENAKDALCGLFNIIRELLAGPRCKFPSINPGNLKTSNWEQYVQKEPQ
jgi:hypothetical protein